MKKVHFISIGGSIMHSLAIALHQKGVKVTGSDDEIYSPSKEKLAKYGLLPTNSGWHKDNINESLDAVILGMHAKADNPELIKARELNLPIYSFPEFIKKESESKQRIVIAGSHGKTTITGMIVHVLKQINKEFDYLIGAELKNIDNQIKLTDAPIIIIEGDEYLTSPLDKTPKFLKYEHHIGLISGISWDHINAYPTFEEYVHQFDIFGDATPKAGSIIFCGDDSLATVIGAKERNDVNRLEYNTHPHKVIDGKTYLITPNGDLPVKTFGKHNMQNIAGAQTLLKRIGVTDEQFYEAIKTFENPRKRLQKILETEQNSVYLDYAHAPSKVAATSKAVKEQYNERALTAVVELHTYSSLNKDFIDQYQESLNDADEAIVFVNPANIKNKEGLQYDEDDIQSAFQHPNLKVFTEMDKLENFLKEKDWANKNLLLMSSGHFAGMDIPQLLKELF